MITDAQKDDALLRYYQRGILKKEARSYEVSLWTLQDEFITVLKWSDVEQKGRIEEPKMTLDVDGTQNFTFSIPMYIMKWDENANYHARMQKIENPIWYNTQNGNLIEGMRKIKVIFNKGNVEQETFEFVIIKVTEKHEGDITTCEVECEGLAFHELGKVGYKLSLSQDNFELVYKEWAEKGYWTKHDGTTSSDQPIQTIQYWCEEGAHLVPLPVAAQRNAQTWYYQIDMDWSSFAFSQDIGRDKHKVYEEPFTVAWTADLNPTQIQQYREKARPVEADQSNLYNITQTIAEQFGVHCRYEYIHDENNQITSKVVVFYNNYNRENEGILEFTYPYSSNNVSRNVDVTDLTTKLYISSIDSDNSLEGVINIMNSPANKIKEDYILNFDYMHKIGGITDEQYDAIHTYEVDIRKINEELIPLQLELEAFETKKIEVSAKLTAYDNSLKLDQEQIDYNQGLGNALTVQNGDSDGYIAITAASPDQGMIVTPDKGTPYINLQYSNKGIDVNTLHLYRSWIAGEQRCTDEITKFKPVTDPDYGNLIKIEGVKPTENSKFVYMTYKYKPQLYYDNIVKTWQIKYANDLENRDDLQDQLDVIDDHIENDTERIKELIAEKDAVITAFERMMGPALREGYWNPEDYSDYGEMKNETLSLPETAMLIDFTTETDDEVVVGWDHLLFDEEDKIYYETGVNLNRVYYPCINLSSIFESNPNNIREHINEYSFIFNTNYYDSSADLTNAKYIRAFAVGSEALLRYVRNTDGDVFPVLVLVGAKNMPDGSNGSTDELTFMKSQNNGHPRLGIYNVTINNDTVTTSITNAIPVHATSYWTFGTDDIASCIQVVPRIKFTNVSVKADTNNLKIAYNNLLLEPYTNYQILTRVTHYGTAEHPYDKPEYYITIKPDVLWRCMKPVTDTDSDFGKLRINYIVSNLSTSIYVDALEIAKKNSEPKVEYDLEANIVDENITHTLYNELARIIMITDVDLKLKDAFGYISHMELDLDQPQNDSIEIKNYTSKFEDLFSTIVASTEAVQRDSDGVASALNGNIGLSATGLAATLLDNDQELTSFLDTYFTSSPTVQESLESLFTEAGVILGNSNKVLGTATGLTQENAGILNNFASQVISELSPKVTRGVNQPSNFKVGDIWVEVEEVPNTNPKEYREVGRYVATSDSLHSMNGYGFTRTYDGTLAAIQGASLNIDAVSGQLEILAENRIDMKSGGNIYIAANEKVDIVGNKAVNIGGTTINIGSTVIDGSTVQGGVNIVATAYGTEDFEDAYTSKVLIHPDEIYMAGSQITMLTGTDSEAVSAIKIDGRTVENGGAAYGIWLGSDKGIRLFSGEPTIINNQTTYGANVEINPSHIFFGMGNTSNTAATAVEMTDGYIIMSAGVAGTSSAVSNVDNIASNGITLNGNLAGIEIKKDKIGLAIGSGDQRSAIIMNDSGLIIGNKGSNNGQIVNPEANGTYVSISGAGIIIGSHGTFTATTDNFVVNPAPQDLENYFYVGDGGNSPTSYVRYVKDELEGNHLDIKGRLTANELYIMENGSPTEATNWVNAKVTPEEIWFKVKQRTDPNYQGTQTEPVTSISLTNSGIAIKTGGTFSVSAANVIINTSAGNGESIFKLSNGSSGNNAVNYFNLAKNSAGGIFAQIGGWLIEEHKLSSGGNTDRLYVALDSDTNSSYAMWAGKVSPGDTYTGQTITLDGTSYKVVSSRGAPFRVTRNGRVYMDKLMLWDSDHHVYKEVDFSDFNQAVSLTSKWSGGQGDGLTITSTASFWGKFEKEIKDTVGVTLDYVHVTSLARSEGGTANVFATVQGAEFMFTGIHLDGADDFLLDIVQEERAVGFGEASSYVSPSAGTTINLDYGESKSITVPVGDDYDEGTITVNAPEDNYNTGWNACLSAVRSQTKTYYEAGGTLRYYTSDDGVTVSGGPYTRTVQGSQVTVTVYTLPARK